MKIFVTSVAGPIGSSLYGCFLTDGHGVTGLDNPRVNRVCYIFPSRLK